jgi:hypothetical protein
MNVCTRRTFVYYVFRLTYVDLRMYSEYEYVDSHIKSVAIVKGEKCRVGRLSKGKKNLKNGTARK